jgi:hypothetical protein
VRGGRGKLEAKNINVASPRLEIFTTVLINKKLFSSPLNVTFTDRNFRTHHFRVRRTYTPFGVRSS